MSVAGSVGVVDTGVVLSVMHQARRSHAVTTLLFESAMRGRVTLHISAVHLAEVLQHAAADVQSTGLDPVAFLDAFKVAIHRPDVGVARAVAALRGLPRLSLADRFAAATAQVLGARLHTTDGTLAAALRARRVPVTLY